jgi:hypothetical protein
MPFIKSKKARPAFATILIYHLIIAWNHVKFLYYYKLLFKKG